MLKVSLVTLILTLLIACGKSPSNGDVSPIGSGLGAGGSPSTPRDGGQDSGGGDHTGSNYEEIKKIFQETDVLLDDLNALMINLYNSNSENDKDFIAHWGKTFSNSDNNFERFVQNIKLRESCRNEKNEITSAATVKLKTGYEICINLSKLSLIPLNSLKVEIHGLLFHELTHVMKLSHDDGTRIQKIVVENYSELSGKKSAGSQVVRIFQKSADILISQLKDLTTAKPKKEFLDSQLTADETFREKLNNITSNSVAVLEQSIDGLTAELTEYNSKHPNKEVEKMLATIQGTKNYMSKLHFINSFMDPKTESAKEDKKAFFKTYIDPKGPQGNYYHLHDEFSLMIKNLKNSKAMDFSKAKLGAPTKKP